MDHNYGYFIGIISTCIVILAIIFEDVVEIQSEKMEKKINITDSCLDDIKHAFFNFSNSPSPYLDATGKPGSGLLGGNTAWLGNFAQCQVLDQSRYCLVDGSVSPLENDSHLIPIRWGLCAVSSCNETSLVTVIPSLVEDVFKYDLHISDVNCVHTLQYSQSFYVVVGLILLLAFLCIVGTLADEYHSHVASFRPKLVYKIDSQGSHTINTNGDGNDGARQRLVADNTDDWERTPSSDNVQKALAVKPGVLTRFFSCFSVSRNMRQIMSTKTNDRVIKPLNGMRVISIAWIVLGHTFLATFVTNIMVNPGRALAYTKSLVWQPVGNAYFAVDTFFFLSGLLVSYMWYDRVQKEQSCVAVFKFYMNRYIRLTPAMGFLMLFWIYIKPYIGDGPIWYNMASDPLCDKYWWSNLLYIQNWYPTDLEHECMGWTWYLAVDMQLYFISPIILVPLYRYKKAGKVIWTLALVGGLIATAAIIGVYKVDVNLTKLMTTGDLESAGKYESLVWGKPYCRLSPYLIGILTGYQIYQEKGAKKTLSKVFVSLGWLLCIVIGGSIIWGLYHTFFDMSLTLTENILYFTLGHLAWPILLAFIVYACWHNSGGIINDVLSWNGFIPLSRLTYSIYLVHAIVLFVIFHSLQTPVFVSNMTIAIYYVGTLGISIAGSVLLMLLVDMPVNNLIDFFTKKPDFL